jgi:hypothetical protein
VLATGGLWTGSSEDAVALVPPFSASYVLRQLRKLSCWPALSGSRSQQPHAVDHLVSTIQAIGSLALPEWVATFECNPVIVTRTSAVVVDAAGFSLA